LRFACGDCRYAISSTKPFNRPFDSIVVLLSKFLVDDPAINGVYEVVLALR
jgi:hypothetical protein